MLILNCYLVRHVSFLPFRRNSIFKSISRSCDVDDGGDDDNARADSPFIDVEALSDDDDEIVSAAESSNDSHAESAVEVEPVKRDLKEEVEVIETVATDLN